MAVVSFIGLFAIQAEGVEDGSILHRKQNGVLIGIIHMLMPSPRWHDEEVAGLPGKALAVNDRITLVRENVIDGAVRLPMRLGCARLTE
jgi:hypothetical protein